MRKTLPRGESHSAGAEFSFLISQSSRHVILFLILMATFSYGLFSTHRSFRAISKSLLEFQTAFQGGGGSTNATILSNSMCRVWGVTTTIFPPSPAIKQLIDHVPGACLVVVGDHKTASKLWRSYIQDEALHERVLFLSDEDQKSLSFSIITHLEWNHFGRKNIGYLVALQHGAQWVYDFEDDTILLMPVNQTFFSKILISKLTPIPVVKNNHHLFNPYPSFLPRDNIGRDLFVWPRGFPLDFIHDTDTSAFEAVTTIASDNISIFQSLADNDPDVDAIYRMTGKLPITFSKHDSMISLSPGMFCPWNTQAVLMKSSVLWGALLPVTVTGRVAGILRS